MDDIRQVVLAKDKNLNLLTIDLHVDRVNKEHFHLALIGLYKHVLGGDYS